MVFVLLLHMLAFMPKLGWCPPGFSTIKLLFSLYKEYLVMRYFKTL